jgi:hypothetical protein
MGMIAKFVAPSFLMHWQVKSVSYLQMQRLYKTDVPHVPTNKAFLDSAELFRYFETDKWTESHIRSVIRYHILEFQFVPSKDFVDGQPLITAVGFLVNTDADVELSGDNNPVLTGRFTPTPVNIIEVDNIATNGVFHVVDQVVPYFITAVSPPLTTGKLRLKKTAPKHPTQMKQRIYHTAALQFPSRHPIRSAQ